MTSSHDATKAEHPDLNATVIKKQELLAKVRALQSEVGNLNVDLARMGAAHAIVACW